MPKPILFSGNQPSKKRELPIAKTHSSAIKKNERLGLPETTNLPKIEVPPLPREIDISTHYNPSLILSNWSVAYSTLPKRIEFAARHGFIDYLKKLLLENPSFNIKTTDVLSVAIMRERMEMVHFLVQNCSIDVNQCFSNGRTPLMQAAFWNILEIARYLLDNNADPNIEGTNPCMTPLNYCLANISHQPSSYVLTHLPMICLLIANKASLDIEGCYWPGAEPKTPREHFQQIIRDNADLKNKIENLFCNSSTDELTELMSNLKVCGNDKIDDVDTLIMEFSSQSLNVELGAASSSQGSFSPSRFR